MTDSEIQPKKPEDKAAVSSSAERVSLGAKLRSSFFAGILVTVPIALTVYLVWVLVHFVDDVIASILPNQWNPNTYLPFDVPGLGLIIFVVAMVFIGAVTASFLGRFFHRRFDRIMNRLPVVRSIYSAIKQIMETVFSQRARAFREAVLVEYPRRDIWTIAFITGETKGEVKNLHEDDIINIYVPTTPNPTSGFLLFVPKRDVIPLGMNVDEALKMVISTGIVTPIDRRPPEVRDRKRIPKIKAAIQDASAAKEA
ncbi:MAG: DUF502 domain-containing protein [Rhodospirillales bacterium]